MLCLTLAHCAVSADPDVGSVHMPRNDMLEGYIFPHDPAHSVFANVTDSYFPFNFGVGEPRYQVHVDTALPEVKQTWLPGALWITGALQQWWPAFHGSTAVDRVTPPRACTTVLTLQCLHSLPWLCSS